MGGPQCAKTIIDNGFALTQAIHERLAVVDRALGCMGTSVNLSASKSPAVYPTEEMEAEFLACTAEAKRAMSAALEPVLKMAAKISKHCEITDG